MPPLVDFKGRVISIGTGLGAHEIADAFLRLHNSKHHASPITLYILGEADALSAMDAMLLTSIMGSIRSPIETIGLGLLTGWQPLLLACGTPGQRYLLQNTLISISPINWRGSSMTRPQIGLAYKTDSETHQIQIHFQRQIKTLLQALDLNPEIFEQSRILSARDAVDQKFADRVHENIMAHQITRRSEIYEQQQ